MHSKPYAFKVYHTAKTFYFAAESLDALNQWIEFIRHSTLSISANKASSSNSFNDINTSELFSENESSGEENETLIIKNLCTPSPQSSKDYQQGMSAVKPSANTPTSTKSDRRYLGSLRKLTKGTLPFKSSSTNEKKQSNDIPVPTDQFRSYRKVPGGSFGIQIGTNTPGYHDTALHPFNAAQKRNSEESPIKRSTSIIKSSNSATLTPEISSEYSKQLSNSENNQCSTVSSMVDATALGLGPPSSPAPALESSEKSFVTASSAPFTSQTFTSNNHTVGQHSNFSHNKCVKKIPYNYIHASNPNLVEFDFQTSRTLDYNLPKINSNNAWEVHPNIQGFVTLKDLMLQKQEEEAQEMYNNRVLLGVEKKEENRRQGGCKYSTKSRNVQESNQRSNTNNSSTTGDAKVSKTQSRSLPKPPDYEISFKPDDEDIQLTRTKEGLKLRDFGYELISGDEPLSGDLSSSNYKNRLSTSRQISNSSAISAEHLESNSSNSTPTSNWATAMKSRPFLLTSGKNKKHSTSSSCSSADYATNGSEKRLGSFKKKGKLESFKTSSEKIFQFGKHSSNTAGITMTLPLNKKSNHKNNETGGILTSACSGIKKSQTYNNDLKEKADKYDAQRKNSAPMPIFSKLSSKNENKKEKKHSNSPLFHRTVVGHHNPLYPQQISSIPSTPTNTTYMDRDYDQEIFAQVVFPKQSANYRKLSTTSSISNNPLLSAPDVTAPPPPTKPQNANLNDITVSSPSNTLLNSTTTTEYPNMECPPVFEPDIYSLTEPNASLLLRRNNNNNASTTHCGNNKSFSPETEIN